MSSPHLEAKGLAHLESAHSVEETVAHLEAALNERKIKIFARIDHAAEAEQVGLKMRPAQVLIFGNPISGTPMMIATPTLAIDLPFKSLVWEDENGKVWLSYNSPEYLMNRHCFPEELLKNLAGLAVVMDKVVR